MSYINKEDLLATINEVWERKYERSNDKVLYDLYRMVVRRINRAPVADIVEVVRCKDCKYIETTEYGGYCCANDEGVAYNDYCGYGERREDNE